MALIQSFVFLDLETTGFPWQENGYTKITELAMVAVSRHALINTRTGCLPRVMHKLTQCYKPNRSINPIASKITGVTNQALENESPFNSNSVIGIKHFLAQLHPPICFVVHNGNGFDYPILRAEIADTKIKFPQDIMCVDSLLMFKALLKQRPVKMKKPDLLFDDKTTADWNLDIDESDLVEIQLLEREHSESDVSNVFSISSPENTPEKRKHPVDSSAKNSPVRQSTNKITAVNGRIGYKLTDLYERLLGHPAVDAHRAESDCLLLLECSMAVAQDAVGWCDAHCELFSDIMRMEKGKKFPRHAAKKRLQFDASNIAILSSD